MRTPTNTPANVAGKAELCAPSGIELHPGVMLLPLGTEEVRRLARRIDPEQTGGISVADMAESLFHIAEEADMRLRHVAALCRAVVALLPGEDGNPAALARHPAFRRRNDDTPEGEALRELMQSISAARELIANGIASACGMLDDSIAQEVAEAGVLSASVAQCRRDGEGGPA